MTEQKRDPISQWYEDKRLEAKTAWEALETAKARGADYMELRRLKRDYDDACYVGD